MFVTTKLAKIRTPSMFVPSPDTYAKVALTCIKHGAVTCPYFPHRVQLTLIKLLPEWLRLGFVKNMHTGLRKRGMAKRERESKGE